MRREYAIGDMVVFRKQKRGNAPSPRAKNLRPAQHGDDYGYEIEKYWRVCQILPNGILEVMTRRGKRHQIAATDARLRHANWFERWFLASRFPSIETSTSTSASTSTSMSPGDPAAGLEDRAND